MWHILALEVRGWSLLYFVYIRAKPELRGKDTAVQRRATNVGLDIAALQDPGVCLSEAPHSWCDSPTSLGDRVPSEEEKAATRPVFHPGEGVANELIVVMLPPLGLIAAPLLSGKRIRF